MRSLFVSALLLVACGGKTAGDVPSDASTSDTAATADAPRPDTAIDFASCSQPGTCALATNGCCGTCGTPKLADFTPINTARAAEFRAFTCTDPTPPCPGCATMEDPNLQAFCRGGRCTGVDIRTDALSMCTTDDDCALRYEACCECGASGDHTIIAIRRDKLGAYSTERCPPMTGCPECAPTYPAEMRAACDPATKHCYVQTP